MRIIEKGCDPSIKLAKFKFNCDECDKSIPNPLPQEEGSPGSLSDPSNLPCNPATKQRFD